ncbi:hypothetical protein BjapCC829_47015 (plasmid) [Bradyrhizobium barranii]|uniref:Group II intron maturase-specific domain-containing protein n=1 Tax=Bradyrhizobium barranii TaxID=2992140 RepID=A0ABY3R0X2_9BRAD|nr:MULTISPECIES: group II intron maturase-specific domain-containing protein [Bradyrhizobium]UFW91558.1 hypothetical protein BjapCC829_47015 [Bradyrhizobium japonicum]WFU00069.1 group II intron maturase-specific domain-containing protein [Bradyrhizobium barranii]
MPSNIDPWPEVCDKLNRSLRGWSNYFRYGSRSKAYRRIGNTARVPCSLDNVQKRECFDEHVKSVRIKRLLWPAAY